MARPRGRPRKRDTIAPIGVVANASTASGIDAKGDDNDNAGTAAPGDGNGPAIVNPNATPGGYGEAVGNAPADDNGTVSTSPDKPRRGRPPGSGGKASSIDISGVEKLLLGIHSTLQLVTGAQEFALSNDEARELAKAYADVAKYYPSLTLDNRYSAIATLGAQVSIIYGSRIMAYRMRLASEKRSQGTQQRASQPAPAQQPVPVEQMNGVATPPAKAEPVSKELRTGEIPGVGNIEFPPDHPLMGGRRQH